ncbi:hypothetical protein Ae331Ps2_6327 [Pseudonocardia sp. Ae331_Ps2]|nr:hypothetical protein Ae331Ps2_6327 [Pseudonocardia sp. Ae331_Ps2]
MRRSPEALVLTGRQSGRRQGGRENSLTASLTSLPDSLPALTCTDSHPGSLREAREATHPSPSKPLI